MEPSGKDLDGEEREMHTWGNGMTRRGDTGVHIWLRVLPQAATIRVHFTSVWLFYTRNRLNHLVLARRRRSGTFGLLRYCSYRFYPAAHLEVSEEVRVTRKP